MFRRRSSMTRSQEEVSCFVRIQRNKNQWIPIEQLAWTFDFSKWLPEIFSELIEFGILLPSTWDVTLWDRAVHAEYDLVPPDIFVFGDSVEVDAVWDSRGWGLTFVFPVHFFSFLASKGVIWLLYFLFNSSSLLSLLALMDLIIYMIEQIPSGATFLCSCIVETGMEVFQCRSTLLDRNIWMWRTSQNLNDKVVPSGSSECIMF